MLYIDARLRWLMSIGKYKVFNVIWFSEILNFLSFQGLVQGQNIGISLNIKFLIIFFDLTQTIFLVNPICLKIGLNKNWRPFPRFSSLSARSDLWPFHLKRTASRSVRLLLFLPTWPTAVDRIRQLLFVNERSFKVWLWKAISRI